MSKSSGNQTVPRAMIHKRILEVAAANPDASIDALVTKVPSATANLTERVLDEYGDPAEEAQNGSSETDQITMATQQITPDREELTEKQYETLRAIHEHPSASQRELAEHLAISGATVSNRVNSIDGFRWNERKAFAERVLDTGSDAERISADQSESSTDTELEDLRSRVTDIERQLHAIEEDNGDSFRLDNPKLALKVIHSCLRSETITEEEELELLEVLMTANM